MKIYPNLLETVSRALCAEDIKESVHVLTDEQREALQYFIDLLESNRSLWCHSESKGKLHWKTLWLLLQHELPQEEKPGKFICKIHDDLVQGDITDEFWKEYKRFAEIAIASYDKWLEKRKNKLAT